jgi:hypothetical protein
LAKPNGGTNFYNGATIDVSHTDNSGNADRVRCTVANIPSATSGYAVGCLLSATDTGGIYTNTGTTSSCTFTLLEDAGGSFTLPTTATDSTTTSTTSFAMSDAVLTSGKGVQYTATTLSTGIVFEAKAGGSNTTGRFFSANNMVEEVWGIGVNGHMHSTVSTSFPPTVAMTTQNGITAAAITAGGTDTCGIITTTGTNNNSGNSVIQVTFGKTYTTAVKGVLVSGANVSGSKVSSTSQSGVFVSAASATSFDLTVPADPGALATPSFRYIVIQ